MTTVVSPPRDVRDMKDARGRVGGIETGGVERTVITAESAVGFADDAARFEANCASISANFDRMIRSRREAIRQRNDIADALEGLIEIIDKAGLLNLSNGVQLGPTSWYVKASERLDWARKMLAENRYLSPTPSPAVSTDSASATVPLEQSGVSRAPNPSDHGE